ncbi:MAG: hypothetical protein KJ955_08620 [Nanoarchaeota archaeon]|nr:hypothetical protein [Nanoarchaeota archaeon]
MADDAALTGYEAGLLRHLVDYAWPNVKAGNLEQFLSQWRGWAVGQPNTDLLFKVSEYIESGIREIQAESFSGVYDFACALYEKLNAKPKQSKEIEAAQCRAVSLLRWFIQTYETNMEHQGIIQ